MKRILAAVTLGAVTAIIAAPVMAGLGLALGAVLGACLGVAVTGLLLEGSRS